MRLTPQELRAAYERGENIMALVRGDAENNDEQTIELSYDLQAGSYLADYQSRPEAQTRMQAYTGAMAALIQDLGGASSLLEAGVGEATTFKSLLSQLTPRPAVAHGFDLCWSRVAVGSEWLQPGWEGTRTRLLSGSLLHVPYLDNSFDIVFTTHALEPNRGREKEIITELCRVASRYVILLEPAYELASPEARARMDRLGYVRDLPGAATALGWRVLRHELFPHAANPLNPTALTVIAKKPEAAEVTPTFACPLYGTALQERADCFYSPESMRAYPVIGGIPCLRREHAIIASRLGHSAP